MSRRPDSFMPWYIGDYLRDTMHLTTRQHGAYDLLLLRYWASGGPLPNDENQLRTIAKLTPAEWRADRAKILAFFRAEDDGLHQKRADLELARAASVYARRKDASDKANAAKEDRRAHRHGRRNGVRGGDRSGSQPQPQPHDLNPSGSNLCGARPAPRGGGAAPPARRTDWAAPLPLWTAFRAKIGESAWNCWFAPCRPGGAETLLIAPGAHTRDEMRARFGPALEAHFGAPVAIECEGAATGA
jgi:uncharacterized protein YdaU (DUF1376 family)